MKNVGLIFSKKNVVNYVVIRILMPLPNMVIMFLVPGLPKLPIFFSQL